MPFGRGNAVSVADGAWFIKGIRPRAAHCECRAPLLRQKCAGSRAGRALEVDKKG